MKWKQNMSDTGTFFGDKEALFGTKHPEEQTTKQYKVKELDKIEARIRKAAEKNELVYVAGDYDADGICSLTEFDYLLEALGCRNYTLRAPRRISEGYGLSENIVNEIVKGEPGLCILVDNGIAAAEQVRTLTDYGWDTIIMDHHKLREDGELPEADIVLDPEAVEGQADFTHYCGAGLVYKLAEHCDIPEKTKEKIMMYAAAATCADCVPLVDKETHGYDNWLIVRNGLALLNDTKTEKPKPLYVLIRSLGIDSHINEGDFGYRVGPVFNAYGRLHDDGANEVVRFLTDKTAPFAQLEKQAESLIAMNNSRKDMQKKIMEGIADKIGTPEADIIVVKSADIPEGLVGLAAGDIVTAYHIPAIVFTETPDGNLKGSARSVDGVNIFDLISRGGHLLTKFGGHEKAAGLSLHKDNFAEFAALIKKEAGPYREEEQISYYDYPVTVAEAEGFWKQTEQFKPYGEENPAPVVMIPDYEIKSADIIGATKQTLKMRSGNKTGKLTAVNFKGSGIEQYKALKNPFKARLLGSLSVNSWHGNTELQIVFNEMKDADEA